MHVVAAKAVCFLEALQPSFKLYAQSVIDNAQALAEVLAIGGLRLISGGTRAPGGGSAVADDRRPRRPLGRPGLTAPAPTRR